MGATSTPKVMVDQRHRSFSPDALTLHKGDTVQFSNSDPYPHQIYVESPAMHYESGIQAPGAADDVTFATAGTFEVRCAIHPRMLLHVDVQ